MKGAVFEVDLGGGSLVYGFVRGEPIRGFL